MDDRSSIVLNLKSTLNRAITIMAYPTGKPVPFTIYHHKITSGLQFEVDNHSGVIKNKLVKVNMYRNLENCDFCKVFFELETLKSNNQDFQTKFTGLKRSYDKHILQFFKERLDLYSVDGVKDNDNSDRSKNYISISGWKLHDLNDDLIFFFIQRRCFNTITASHIIRTAGLQFSTDRSLDFLSRYVKNLDQEVTKVSKLTSYFSES